MQQMNEKHVSISINEETNEYELDNENSPQLEKENTIYLDESERKNDENQDETLHHHTDTKERNLWNKEFFIESDTDENGKFAFCI
ncbi:unnamed protein product [Brachionus calyciflorus]|uniref:Uncharacterized protein n=1 Tax=Brachionus calyciflorus TaxID=104777 RepID=A0A814RQ04_9BILA|nr:unnamed protein product [Brachionus calyciflorus]